MSNRVLVNALLDAGWDDASSEVAQARRVARGAMEVFGGVIKLMEPLGPRWDPVRMVAACAFCAAIEASAKTSRWIAEAWRLPRVHL